MHANRFPTPLALALALAITFTLGVLALPATANAQSRLREPDASDRIARLLFAPEFVMRHQNEIRLTGKQKDILIEEMQAAQSDLVPLQLEMSAVGGSLAKLLASERVDEEAAIAAAARVMDLESLIKTRHLVLLIRIRNLLTIDQQTTLRRLRRQQWQQRRNGGSR